MGGDKIKTKYEAQNKYLKEKSKRYVIQCMLNTELDIINHLESQENKAGYIKSLIRADINKKMKSIPRPKSLTDTDTTGRDNYGSKNKTQNAHE